MRSRLKPVLAAGVVVLAVMVAQPAWALVFGGTTTDRLDRIEQQTTAILARVGGTTTTTAPPATTAPTTTAAPVTTVAPTTTATPSTTIAATTTVAPVTTTVATGVLFAEPFTSPGNGNLSIKIHSQPTVHLAFKGDHDLSCAGTITTRDLVEDNTVGTHVYWCNGHLMTAMNTDGYTSITMSPKDAATGRARVFPATANKVCWDQTLTDMGGRKWIQAAVISEARFTANGFKEAYIRPGFEGVASDPTSVVMGADDFMYVGLDQSVEYFRGQVSTFTDNGFNRLNGVADKAARYTTCLTDNRNGTVTRTQTRPGNTSNTVIEAGAFPAGPRVFLLMDESYHPDKAWQDEGFVRVVTDGYTWHWGNINISAG